MSIIKTGDKVKAHYTGKLDDGSIFDSSREDGREPIEFTLGNGELIAGFETGVLGMTTGDSKKIVIEPTEGYGPYVEDLKFNVPIDRLPEGITTGVALQVMTPNGPAIATVLEITDTNAVVDHNHMLAGKRLTFDVEIIEIFSENLL